MNFLIISIAPVAALLIFIYQKDRYDREPFSLLFKNFLFGMLSVIPVFFIEKFLMSFNKGGNPAYTAFAVAGFTEELFKFLVIYFVSFNSVNFDEKLDGIVYSVFVSLGFAGVENVLYVLGAGHSFLYVGIIRALFAVPAHMLFAVTMGYYISMAKFSNKGSGIILLKALIIPMILHGIYDFILISKIFGFLIIFIAYVIYLWRVNLLRLNRYVRESRDRYR